ncbi:hypothetical protein PJJ85_15490 [Mycobacterium kansasii]|uniref:hypothetical protein n=1 Tax=Mycobacterium sp. MS3 TaxID=3391378 RepID=UPI0039896015
MGFYSSNCLDCGHPLLSDRATNEINAWMNLGVAITRDGSLLKGSYDGYGTLTSPDGHTYQYVVGSNTTVWHQACWLVNGSPTDYRGESLSSEDQGWFFADTVHDLAEPTIAATGPSDG